MGNIVPLLVIIAAFVVSGRNAYDSHGHTRLFWGLMTAGMAMWCYNQACWTWFEVVLRKPLPEPSPGAMVLFLHIVPIIAAVAIRPHQVDEREGMLPSTLNVLILLVWWIVAYAFLVFPEEYIVPDVAAYLMRRDLLYRVDEGILIVASATAFSPVQERGGNFIATSSWPRSSIHSLWKSPMPLSCAASTRPGKSTICRSSPRCWGFSGSRLPDGNRFAKRRSFLLVHLSAGRSHRFSQNSLYCLYPSWPTGRFSSAMISHISVRSVLWLRWSASASSPFSSSSSST